MGNIFAGSEIVQMGIEIEKNGRDFYGALIRKMKNAGIKEVFECLLGEEDKHITIFQKLLDRVQRYEPAEAYTDDYFAYMKALADEHIFTQKDKGAQAASGVKTDLEALELGIDFEKKSITFYDGMKKVVPPNDHQILDELIRQERGHLKKLTDIKRGGGDYGKKCKGV